MNLFFRKHKLSRLNKKIIVRIVLISSVITTIITAFSFFNDYSRELDELEKVFQQIEKSNLKSIEQSLWEINTNQINIQIEGLLTIQNIYSIYHLDKRGQKGIEKKKNISPPKYLIEKKMPVSFLFEGKNVDLGELVIVAYKDEIYNGLISRALYVFITQTLKTLIVSLAMYLVFAKLFSNHISKITDFFSQINLESDQFFPELSIRSEKDSNNDFDELDQLVESINNMSNLVAQANRDNKSLIAKQEKTIAEQQVMAINASKLAALGEMAAGIAHEINNPASIITLSTRSLKKEVDNNDPDSQHLYDKIEKIDKSVTRIKNIINSIKSFSRQSESDPFETVNIVETLDEALNFCRERFKSENLDLKILTHGDKYLVSVRESEISQVILNLINNAHDAIEPLNEKWIKIELVRDNGNLNLEFSDSGPGIPVHIREKIFNPFFTTKETGKGTGIGLSLSKKLVENNNGILKLDEEDENTKFILTLPLAA